MFLTMVNLYTILDITCNMLEEILENIFDSLSQRDVKTIFQVYNRLSVVDIYLTLWSSFSLLHAKMILPYILKIINSRRLQR